jgi:hypothetical protein
MKKAIRHIRSAIEDLAFTNRSSRESDEVRWRGCIEHDFVEGSEIRTNTRTKERVAELKS